MHPTDYLINKFEQKHKRSINLIKTIQEGEYEENTFEHLAQYLLKQDHIYGPLVYEFKNVARNDFSLEEINYRGDSRTCLHLLISLTLCHEYRTITFKENKNFVMGNHPQIILEPISKVRELYPEKENEFVYHTSIGRFIETLEKYKKDFYNNMPPIV